MASTRWSTTKNAKVVGRRAPGHDQRLHRSKQTRAAASRRWKRPSRVTTYLTPPDTGRHRRRHPGQPRRPATRRSRRRPEGRHEAAEGTRAEDADAEGLTRPPFLADLYYDLRDRRLLPLVALVAGRDRRRAVPARRTIGEGGRTGRRPRLAERARSRRRTKSLTVVQATPGPARLQQAARGTARRRIPSSSVTPRPLSRAAELDCKRAPRPPRPRRRLDRDRDVEREAPPAPTAAARAEAAARRADGDDDAGAADSSPSRSTCRSPARRRSADGSKDEERADGEARASLPRRRCRAKRRRWSPIMGMRARRARNPLLPGLRRSDRDLRRRQLRLRDRTLPADRSRSGFPVTFVYGAERRPLQDQRCSTVEPVARSSRFSQSAPEVCRKASVSEAMCATLAEARRSDPPPRLRPMSAVSNSTLSRLPHRRGRLRQVDAPADPRPRRGQQPLLRARALAGGDQPAHALAAPAGAGGGGDRRAAHLPRGAAAGRVRADREGRGAGAADRRHAHATAPAGCSAERRRAAPPPRRRRQTPSRPRLQGIVQAQERRAAGRKPEPCVTSSSTRR